VRADLEELIHEHPSIGLKFSASLGLRIPFLEQYLIQQRLRNIELLSALSDDDLRAIAQKLEFQSIERGDLIIEDGAPGDAAFFIEEGHVRLITKSNEGESFDELDEGEIFGNTALTTGKRYTCTARAVSDVNLWVLTRAAYQELIERRPAIKLAFSRALAESLSISDQTDAVERMRALQLFADMPTDSLHALAARLVLRQQCGHQRRVAELARAIAAEMSLTEAQIQGLYHAAIIHDVGKVGVPALAGEGMIALHVPIEAGLAQAGPGGDHGGVAGGAGRARIQHQEIGGGQLQGAALDVFEEEPPSLDHPVMSAPRTLFSPHIASSTGASMERMAELVARQVVQVLRGERPQFVANPEVFANAPDAR
jgi:CRP-like cAMP-binding protein